MTAIVLTLAAGAEASAGLVVDRERAEVAVQRLLTTQRATLELAPAASLSRKSVAWEQAAVKLESRAGAPYLEWQREGIGPGLDDRGNAQLSLRVGSPFHYPWNVGRGRRLGSAARRWSASALSAAEVDLAAEAARRWLASAAATERVQSAQKRVERLGQAVSLQQKRLELGEISGMELTQVRFEWARWDSFLAESTAKEQIARERLAELCGASCVHPEVGDMEALLSATRMPPVAAKPSRLMESAPVWAAAESAAAMEVARGWQALAGAGGLPEIEFEWERVPTLDGVPAFDAAGIRLRIPLRIGSVARLARVEASARERKAEAELEVMRRSLEARIRGLLASARESRRRLDVLSTVAKDLERTEHSLAEQFRLDGISYLEFIDGLGRLEGFRLDLVAAREYLLSDCLELATLTVDLDCFPLVGQSRSEDE